MRILSINVQIPDEVDAASPPYDYLSIFAHYHYHLSKHSVPLTSWKKKPYNTPESINSSVMEYATTYSTYSKMFRAYSIKFPHIPNSLLVFEPMASSCAAEAAKLRDPFRRRFTAAWCYAEVEFVFSPPPHPHKAKAPPNLERKLKSRACLKHSGDRHIAAVRL